MNQTTVSPHILVMAPLWVQKVWGGRRLRSHLNKPLPDDGKPYGESWEVADLPEGQSRVAQGPLKDSTLRQIAQMWGDALYGAHHDDGRFPLLIKFLDAQDDLSVQVHPGQQHETILPGARSKDECWIITASDGGAIYHGFHDPNLRAEDLRVAIEAGRCRDVLRRHEVNVGDVIRIPPGTIHAILEGVMLLEIQQPSDTTYRVYDYERPGLDGQPRPLHLDEALTVLHFGKQTPVLLQPDELKNSPSLKLERLVGSSAYTIERITLNRDRVKIESFNCAQVVICLNGTLTITHTAQSDIELISGQTVIIPAVLKDVQISGTGQFILTR